MMNSCKVEPLTLSQIVDNQYCLAVGTVGFEQRSRYFFSAYDISSNARMASGFNDRNVMSFNENRKFFENNGFSFSCHDVHEFGKELLGRIRVEDSSERLTEDEPVSVCVDISTMNRLRMAQVMEVLLNSDWQHQVVVDFVYCLSSYSPPPDVPTTIATAGPISNSFSGWSCEPDTATCAVFGVGYEPDRVVGAIEFIEPAFVWAYVPEGPDPRFANKVKEVNDRVWDDVPEQCIVQYKLAEPFNTFVNLESLVYSLSQQHRPILIPFGPKLFTIQCLLAATIHSPKVAVWRVSGGETAEAENKEASGDVYALRVIIDSAQVQVDAQD